MPKKDLAGKNKTKDTYEGDWVRTKVRQKGGKFVYAVVSKAQAKKIASDEGRGRDLRNARNATASAPTATTPTPTTTTVPIDTTSLGGVPNQSITVPQPPATSTVPSWWIGQAIQNPDENQAFANAANALMPTLSPEDAQSLATTLATNYKDVFGGYSALKLPIPTQITNEREAYLNPLRAQKAIQLLDKMQSAAGGDAAKFGKGYDFLRNAINLMNKFNTPGQPMTREQYAQFQAAVQAMQASAGKDIGAYANLAQLFNLPSFTAGPIVSNTPAAGLNV